MGNPMRSTARAQSGSSASAHKTGPERLECSRLRRARVTGTSTLTTWDDPIRDERLRVDLMCGVSGHA